MLSVAAHVLLFLLLILLPQRLPDLFRRLFAVDAVAARPSAGLPASPESPPASEISQPVPEKRPPEAKIPLKFVYVRVPEDEAAVKNPQARLLSDRDRRARQEVPTPPDTRQFTPDPHAQGNSRDRVRPDPSLREGPDSLAQVRPPAASRPAGGGDGEVAEPKPGPDGNESDITESRKSEQDAGAGGPARELPPDGAGGSARRTPGSGPGVGDALDGREDSLGDQTRRTPRESQGVTEHKFTFSNPGWLRGQSFGTLSFDTQGFPWGDYARQLYVIIRNNWLARIPPAADFVRGYSCQHFTIERDGTISAIDMVHVSPHPPFNKVASDALRASNPLPPLPAEFPEEREGVTACFFYNMYPAEAD